jgi:hypothetical protein
LKGETAPKMMLIIIHEIFKAFYPVCEHCLLPSLRTEETRSLSRGVRVKSTFILDAKYWTRRFLFFQTWRRRVGFCVWKHRIGSNSSLDPAAIGYRRETLSFPYVCLPWLGATSGLVAHAKFLDDKPQPSPCSISQKPLCRVL